MKSCYIHTYPFVMRSSPLLGIGMHNQRIWGLKDYQEGHSSYFMSIIRREILLFFLLGLLLCVFSCNLSMLCLNDEQKKSTTDIIYIVVTFLSMSLLGASRSYFYPPSPPLPSNPPWNFLIFYISYTKYFEIQKLFLSLSLSLSFSLSLSLSFFLFLSFSLSLFLSFSLTLFLCLSLSLSLPNCELRCSLSVIFV